MLEPEKTLDEKELDKIWNYLGEAESEMSKVSYRVFAFALVQTIEETEMVID